MNSKAALLCAIGSSILVACAPPDESTKGDETPKPPTGSSVAASAPTATPAASDGAPDQTAQGTDHAPQPPAPPSPVLYSLCAAGLPEDGMWKCDPVLADVNGDGILDLAALPRLGEGPRVWLGDGTGSWSESSTGLEPGKGSCGGGLDLVDVNLDGNLDLIAGDHCNGIYVYLGDGAGHWQKVVQELFPRQIVAREGIIHHWVGAEDITCTDVNGDGFPDLIAASSDDGGINVYKGDGTGTNWEWDSLSPIPTGWAVRVITADLNADGKPDIVASHSDGPRAWINGGDDGWTAMSEGLPSPMIRGLYMAMATGDVDEDGRVDIIAANWVDGPEVYLQQADGTWLKTADVFPGMRGGSTGIAVSDLDADGHLDLVVSGRTTLERGHSRGVYAMKGDGAGGWTYLADSGLPNTGLLATPGLLIRDINADSVPDVIACSGLKVESNMHGPQTPAIAQRIMVFCGKRR